jgi:hypothetical protein
MPVSVATCGRTPPRLATCRVTPSHFSQSSRSPPAGLGSPRLATAPRQAPARPRTRLDGIILDDALYDGAFTCTEAVAAGAERFDMYLWGPPQ